MLAASSAITPAPLPGPSPSAMSPRPRSAAKAARADSPETTAARFQAASRPATLRATTTQAASSASNGGSIANSFAMRHRRGRQWRHRGRIRRRKPRPDHEFQRQRRGDRREQQRARRIRRRKSRRQDQRLDCIGLGRQHRAEQRRRRICRRQHRRSCESELVRPVTGTSDSYLGGLVGVNFALIQDSTSILDRQRFRRAQHCGRTGRREFRVRSIHRSRPAMCHRGRTALSAASSAPTAHSSSPTERNESARSRPTRAAPGRRAAAPGSTVGPQVGQSYPTSGLPDPPERTCDNGGQFCGGILFNPDGSPPQPKPDIATNLAQVSPLLNITAQFTNDTLTEKKQDEVVDTKQGTPGTAGSSGGPSGQKGGGTGRRQRRPAAGQRRAAARPRPAAERHAADQRDALRQQRSGDAARPRSSRRSRSRRCARQYGLEVISQPDGSACSAARSTASASPAAWTVRAVIAGLQNQIGAQDFGAAELCVRARAEARRAGRHQPQGDSAQYIVAKLGLVEAHGIATGKNVKVAVIDSRNRRPASRPRGRHHRHLRRAALDRPDRRTRTAPAWRARSARTSACSASRPARASSASAPSA